MSVFSNATLALSAALKTLAAEPVTYTSAASGKSVTLLAVRGRSTLAVESTDGAILEVLSNDWLVDQVDLNKLGSGSGGYTPAKLDTITTTPSAANPIVQTYQLMEKPPYSRSDHAGTRLRLHSVQIG